MSEFINGGMSFVVGMLVMKLMANNGYRGWALAVSLLVMVIIWFVLEFKDYCQKG